MAKKKKHPGGRPSKYRPEFCNKLIEFFDVEPFRKIELPHYQKDGVTLRWMDYKIIPNRMPTLLKFARSIGVGYRTVYDWMDEKHSSYHQEFSQAFTIAKQLRKDFLNDLGLSGLTPPASFKFIAINVTDMIDEKVVDDKSKNRLTDDEYDRLRQILKERQQAKFKVVKSAG